MRAFYPVCQVAELAAGYGYTTRVVVMEERSPPRAYDRIQGTRWTSMLPIHERPRHADHACVCATSGVRVRLP